MKAEPLTFNSNRATIFRCADSWGKRRPLWKDLLSIKGAVVHELSQLHELPLWTKFRLFLLFFLYHLLFWELSQQKD
jgi:hypothetical protein